MCLQEAQTTWANAMTWGVNRAAPGPSSGGDPTAGGNYQFCKATVVRKRIFRRTAGVRNFGFLARSPF